MELTSAFLTEYLIETVSPVDTHKTYHRQENAHAQTGAALHVERIKSLGIVPRITGLYEPEPVDSGIAE